MLEQTCETACELESDLNPKLLYPILKLLPALQEQRGDRLLEKACETARKFESDIPESDRNIIKERIAM
jgi:hypothetical protein